jgi:hypothetical protein
MLYDLDYKKIVFCIKMPKTQRQDPLILQLKNRVISDRITLENKLLSIITVIVSILTEPDNEIKQLIPSQYIETFLEWCKKSSGGIRDIDENISL